MLIGKLVLASQSPRRRKLLEDAGYAFVVDPPHPAAEDGRQPREAAAELVARLAGQKAADVAARHGQALVLGCDTVAECGGQILGKPADRADAARMLRQLSGRVHHVYSGLCLWQRPGDRRLVRVATTKLKMAPLTDRQLNEYLDSGQWAGKAGAFGFQDRLSWIRIVAGSESNVVGLPLELLRDMLVEMGYQQ